MRECIVQPKNYISFYAYGQIYRRRFGLTTTSHSGLLTPARALEAIAALVTGRRTVPFGLKIP